jgi:uncharacterized MAPEG superfamily protein
MTIAFWCILVAIFMPYVTTVIAKRTMPLRENRAPRLYKEGLTGVKQRAVWAENNHFESLPGFVAGVIIAHLAAADQGTVDALAVVYISARALYTWVYLTDRSTLRSLFWFVGLGCIVGFFICAAVTGSVPV